MEFLSYLKTLSDNEKHNNYLPLKKYSEFCVQRNLNIDAQSGKLFIDGLNDELKNRWREYIRKYVRFVTGEDFGEMDRGEVNQEKKLTVNSEQLTIVNEQLSVTKVSPAGSDNLRLSEVTPDIHSIMKVVDYIDSSISENTKRAYAADWKDFCQWCEKYSLIALPATAPTVMAYISTLADEKKVSTIERRLAAIKFYHDAKRLPSPTTEFYVKKTLEGIGRKKRIISEAKKPILGEDIQKICKYLSPAQTLIDKRDKALLLMIFAGTFRRSEVVNINCEDVNFVPDKGILVQLAKSKTDQKGEGISKAIHYGQNWETCPVLALQDWLDSAHIKMGALFRSFDSRGKLTNRRLNDKSVSLIVKRLMEMIGRKPEDYGVHSLRSGAATQAALAGADDKEIMLMGGWRSRTMVDRYVKPVRIFEQSGSGKLGL